jgi:hypothetical protein
MLRLLWYISASILAFMFVYYVVCSIRLAVKFDDAAAMRMVVLYFVRALAWFSGAVITAVRLLVGGRR